MARQIAAAVAQAGGRAYYVGGFVRDRLLGIDTKDVDMEIHGVPAPALEAILDRLGTRTQMGASFGIYGLRHYDIDIALPRKEHLSGRGHRDFAVFTDPFLGPEKAAMRRDFTVNALMEDVLTGEILDFFQDFYTDFDRSRAESMLRALKLDPEARLKTLSKGNQEKVQLVLVMSRKAKLYLLDEPIGGVDPAARDYILNTIITNYDPGATVLISTHLIGDVERVLDEFIFLSQGKVIRQGSTDEVREETGTSLDELFREVFKCLEN